MNPLSSTSASRSNPLPPSVRAEAAAWVARLHSSGRSRALESGLKRWLEADPVHTQAFELATEAWEIGGSIPGGALPRVADPFKNLSPFRSSAPRARSYLAIAAALCALIVSTVLYLNRERPAISTGVGEQRMLILDDGTRVYLNTDTRLFVRQEPARRSVRLQNGEAMFDVAKDPRRPFVVTAGNREVVALGTSFVVRHDPASTTVTLVEGKVTVARLSERSQARAQATRSPPGAGGNEIAALTPGQRLVLAEDRQPKLDEPSLDKVTAWRRGEVILDKSRLQDAADEMNRYSTVKLVVDNPQAADIRVSGIFRVGDSARFAQAVSETYHLQVDHQDRRIVIR